MEVPAVFEIHGDGRRTGTGHDITATIKPEGGQPSTVKVDPDGRVGWSDVVMEVKSKI